MQFLPWVNRVSVLPHWIVSDIAQPFGGNPECNCVLVKVVITVMDLIFNKINILAATNVKIGTRIAHHIFPFKNNIGLEHDIWKEKCEKGATKRWACATCCPCDVRQVILASSSLRQIGKQFTEHDNNSLFFRPWLHADEFAKRKCGANFVYQSEGSDKAQTKINDAIPHTWKIWDIGVQNTPCHMLTRNECCSLSFCLLKTVRFSD